MATIGSLAVNIVANTGGLVRGVNKSRGVIRQFASFTGLHMLSVGAAVVSVGRSFQGLEQSMTRSLAIMGGVSRDMRRRMTEAALDVSRTSQFSARQAAEAYFFLASAGLNAEQSLKSMPIVAKFAQAGNFDLALATDLVTDSQSALGMSSKDTATHLKNMTRVSDVLVKGNILANASVQQLSEALTNKAAASARMVGKDIEEVVAVLNAFADQGLKGAAAGDAFSIVMRDLQTKALQNASKFRVAGVAVFDAAGEMRNMADIVFDLENLLNGLSDAQKKHTLLTLGFSDKSVAYVQALLGTSEKIREYEKGLRGAGGAAEEVANKSLTQLEKSVNRLRGEFERLAQAMAKPVSMLADFLGMAEAIATGDVAGLRGYEQAANSWRKVIDSMPKGQFDTFAGQLAQSGGDTRARVPIVQRQLGFTPDTWVEMEHIFSAVTKRLDREFTDLRAKVQAQENAPTLAEAAMGKFNDMLEGLPGRVARGQLAVQDFVERGEASYKDWMKRQLKFNLIEAPAALARAQASQRKEIQDAQRQAERALARDVDQMVRSVMKPAEQAKQEIDKALSFFSEGQVSADTVGRLIRKWDQRLGGQQRHLGITRLDSQEGMLSRRGGDARKDPMSRLAETAKEQLAVLKKIHGDQAAMKEKRNLPFVGDINVKMNQV